MSSRRRPQKIQAKSLVNTKFFYCWKGMYARCYTPSYKEYKNYGGRGIRVCPRWHLFDFFVDDMLASYVEGYQLHRTDNDGHYCKENCQWLPSYMHSWIHKH